MHIQKTNYGSTPFGQLMQKLGCIGDNTIYGSFDDDNLEILKNLACMEKGECVVEVLC